MKNIISILIAIIIININKSEAQKIFIYTDKTIYRSNDTIQIKLINKNSIDLVYAVGLEININNKWEELESDIVNPGTKVERWKSIKKSETLINKIILPEYITKIVMRNDKSIRFRMKYGPSYKKTSEAYSNIIKIIQKIN